MRVTYGGAGSCMIVLAIILILITSSNSLTGNVLGRSESSSTLVVIAFLSLVFGILLVKTTPSLDAIIVPTQADENRDREKARAAAALYRSGGTKKIIASGGKTPALDKRYASGAQVIQETLLAEGVPEKDILLEERAQDNIENLQYSIPLIRGNNVGILSYSSHVRRFEYLFEKGQKEGFFSKQLHLQGLEIPDTVSETIYEKAAMPYTAYRTRRGLTTVNPPSMLAKKIANTVMKLFKK